jgi:hypothetical protein
MIENLIERLEGLIADEDNLDVNNITWSVDGIKQNIRYLKHYAEIQRIINEYKGEYEVFPWNEGAEHHPDSYYLQQIVDTFSKGE